MGAGFKDRLNRLPEEAPGAEGERKTLGSETSEADEDLEGAYLAAALTRAEFHASDVSTRKA
jgi:hypothetical protein